MDSPRKETEMTYTDQKQFARVKRAISQLVIGSPFFGVCLLKLELVESYDFETGATDGKRLIYNPAFVAGLTDAKLRGFLAHEVSHCTYEHFARMGTRDNELWNVATDHAINLDLLDSGFDLPDGALADEKWRGMAAEEVYAAEYRTRERQKKESGKAGGNGKPGAAGSGAPQNGSGDRGDTGKPGNGKPATGSGKPGNGQAGSDPGKCGGVIAPADATEAAEIAAQWKATVMQAAAIAEKQAGAGSLPGSIRRMVAEAKTPRVDWREALRRFVTESQSRDYTWARPNRRHIASGLYLPSMVSDGRGRIIVGVDTSGSIDDSALAAFGAELQDVLDSGAADCVTVVYCDTRIQGVAEYEAGQRIKLDSPGGGGTKFSPVMDWTREHGTDAACLVYFTDLDCHDFGTEPGIPVMWANWNRPRPAPFGEIVQLDPHN